MLTVLWPAICLVYLCGLRCLLVLLLLLPLVVVVVLLLLLLLLLLRYRGKVDELEQEKKATEAALQPLHLKLLDLDEQLKESKAKIGALKANISKNDQRVEHILQSVVS